MYFIIKTLVLALVEAFCSNFCPFHRPGISYLFGKFLAVPDTGPRKFYNIIIQLGAHFSCISYVPLSLGT